MNLAAKVWAGDEGQPEGLFNKATCPNAPANWFREEPPYAAELYAMERFDRKSPNSRMTVYVLDTAGVLHTFNVQVGLELTAKVLG